MATKRTKPTRPDEAEMLSIGMRLCGQRMDVHHAQMVIDMLALLRRKKNPDLRDCARLSALWQERLVKAGLLHDATHHRAMRSEFQGYNKAIDHKKPLECTGRYTIERLKDAKGKVFYRRTAQGFSGADLMLLLGLAQHEVADQLFNQLRPITERVAIEQEPAARTLVPQPGEGTHGAGSDNR